MSSSNSTKRQAHGEFVWVLDGKTQHPAKLVYPRNHQSHQSNPNNPKKVEIQWISTGKFSTVPSESISFQEQEEGRKQQRPSRKVATMEMDMEKEKDHVPPDTQTQTRRSQRERKSRTIQVDGQTVLKTNNYVVKGMSYDYGVLDENEGDSNKKTSASKSSRSEPASKPAATRSSATATAAITGTSSSNEAEKDDSNNIKTGVSKYYLQEVLGHSVEIKFEMEDECGQTISSRFYLGRIKDVKITYQKGQRNNGGGSRGQPSDDNKAIKEVKHFVEFDEDGDARWIDLAHMESTGGLKWPKQQQQPSKLSLNTNGDNPSLPQQQHKRSDAKKKKSSCSDEADSAYSADDDVSSTNDAVEADFSSDGNDEEDAWSEHEEEDGDDADGDESLVEDEYLPKKRKRAARKSVTTLSKSNSRPRKTTKSQWERRRMEHNEAVKSRTQEKSVFRTQFLVDNIKLIEPLVDELTTKKILSTNHKNSKEENTAASAAAAEEEEGQQESSSPSYKARQIHVQPDLIKGEMRDYQMIGLQFLVNMYNQNLGMIMGDEMGLGKTLQTISFLCYLKETCGITGPSLVVCPMTVLSSWCKEIQKWAPTIKFHRVHSPDATEQENQRKILAERGSEFDIVLTTYEMIKAPKLSRAWNRLHFNMLVLDEGHRIKNNESQISIAARKIHCENRLILSGTPLQNNLVELWSLLNFLFPDIFVTSQPFQDAFNINCNRIDDVKLKEARNLLNILMIRRLKDEVEKLLPKKIETKVYCPLSKTQLFWYKALLMKDWSALERVNEKEVAGRAQAKTHRNLLENLVMQLRKCCLHPFLFEGAEEDIATTSCEELVGASGKLSVLDMLLISLFQKGHRCVLFSQFTRVLDILEDYCRMRGWKYCRLDGSTARAKRNFLVDQFNATPSPFFVFLMSTRSGGVGLNLQSADTCILYDSDWNPQMDLQAMARVHRLGQQKTVHVYRLVSGGTVEERILQRAECKLLLDHSVNPANNASTVSSGALKLIEEGGKTGGLTAKELFADIKFGAAAVFGDSSENELPSSDDIAFITDRNRTESDSKGRLKGNEMQDVASFDTLKKLSSTQEFGGIDFRKIRQERAEKEETNVPENLAGIAHLWRSISQLQKRQVKKRIVLVNVEGTDLGEETVPVLNVNKDDADRESESRGQSAVKVQKFEHSDYCQLCGDGGLLTLCPRCPAALHPECCDIKDPKLFVCCPHHRCSVCEKNNTRAGGMLFACVMCTVAFCEECLPRDSPGLRFVGDCYRFKGLGFDTSKLTAYIHCSVECEAYGISEFGWDPSQLVQEQVCPLPIDVSANFGGKGEEVTLRALGSDGPEDVSGPRTCSKGQTYVYSDGEEFLHDDEKKIASSREKGSEAPTRSAAVDRVPSSMQKEGSSSDSSVSSDEIQSLSSEEEAPTTVRERKNTSTQAKQQAPVDSTTANNGSSISQQNMTSHAGFGKALAPSHSPQRPGFIRMNVCVPNPLHNGQKQISVTTPFGNQISVTIPSDAVPGSMFSVQVPNPEFLQQQQHQNLLQQRIRPQQQQQEEQRQWHHQWEHHQQQQQQRQWYHQQEQQRQRYHQQEHHHHQQQQPIVNQMNPQGVNNNQFMGAQEAIMGGPNRMAMMNHVQPQNAMNINLMQQQNSRGGMRMQSWQHQHPPQQQFMNRPQWH